MKAALIASAIASGAVAQQTVWGQCGGIGWTGPTTCVSGSGCVKQNDWYFQCLPGAPGGPAQTTTLATSTTKAAVTTTTKTTTSTKPATSTPSSSGKFKWFGINESGAEFGQGIFPGTLGKDYIFPSTSTIGVRHPHTSST